MTTKKGLRCVWHIFRHGKLFIYLFIYFTLIDCHYSIIVTQWHQKKGLRCIRHISSPGNLFFVFFFFLLTMFYLEPTWDRHITSIIEAWPNEENKLKWPKRGDYFIYNHSNNNNNILLVPLTNYKWKILEYLTAKVVIYYYNFCHKYIY